MLKILKTKILPALLILLVIYLTSILAIWTIISCQDSIAQYGFNIGVIVGLLEFWVLGIVLLLFSLLKCPKCKTKLKLNQNFCVECGEKFTKIETLKKNFCKKHIFLILLVVLLSIFTYFLMIHIFNSDNEQTKQSVSIGQESTSTDDYGIESLVEFNIEHKTPTTTEVFVKYKNLNFSKEKMLNVYNKSKEYCSEYCGEYGELPSSPRMCQADLFEKEGLRKEFVAIWNFVYYTTGLEDVDKNIVSAITNHETIAKSLMHVGNIPPRLKKNYELCKDYCSKATENARGNGEFTECFEERLEYQNEKDFQIYKEIYNICNELTTNECDKDNCIHDLILSK